MLLVQRERPTPVAQRQLDLGALDTEQVRQLAREAHAMSLHMHLVLCCATRLFTEPTVAVG
jgi:hypothetical protein